mmetsp:Transcript_81210/g.214165  ORF Transcript_81210/g.214165 Transcript_81210/m.214165 type:complete len:106 (+) Transcript_81210:109-426(+)
MGNSGSYSAVGNTQTQSSGKKYHTKCICVGCGCSENMCEPALATDVRCCCFEAAVKIDPSLCKDTDQLCVGRMGLKVLPVVVDLTNPLVDRHELIVVCEKQVCSM